MHKINNISNHIFVAVFMLLLWVPMLHISKKEKSDTENRILAVMPNLVSDGKINNKYGEEFNAWFNDRFFGRDALIGAHNNIMNKLQSGQDTAGGNQRVLIGRDNWLFYKADRSLRNFTNTNTPTKEQMANGLAYLKDIDDWCKQHNKKFYFFIAPDKNKIYPEFFPTYINKIRPDSEGLGMTLYNYIRENSDINVIYPYAELIEAKGDDLLYYTTDTHWNMWGAYVGFNAMHRKIFNRDFNGQKFIRRWGDEVEHRGDLLQMLNLKDDSEYTKVKFKRPEFFNNIECEKTKMYSTDAGLVTCKNAHGNGVRAFVLRDSFSTALTPYMAQVFSKADLHWKYNIEKSDLDAIASDYDIVILESVERLSPAIFTKQFPKD